jgi:hypothetical protein
VSESGILDCRAHVCWNPTALDKGESLQDVSHMQQACLVRKYGTRFAVTYAKGTLHSRGWDWMPLARLSIGERFRELPGNEF